MTKHVAGELPKAGGTPWEDVDHVFKIAHTRKTHWVLYVLDLMKHEIVMYDTLSSDSAWSETSRDFHFVARNVPLLIDSYRIWDKKGLPYQSCYPWTVRKYQTTPQQTNSWDCGVLSIKMLELLISNWPVKVMKPQLGPEFRRRYCAEIFEGTNLEPVLSL
ncbi:hypothetical protein C2S53_013977 [Perilla frutescens var. hirtella]|uniref:Ubiquitin-like protease family profile domain-containing protein n=1 Tax=Perilla frutescens var. hirtella TaxID=608512 RepID=A0AAD4JPV7_PERFH|nr:hypothetical protein C2S53_013977 [Perilla frutescens var. hirtella]